MSFDLFIEILGFVIGVIYLVLEYYAKPQVWIASVVMPMISMWLYFRKGLYADFAINIYYVVIAVYGYIAWTMRSRKDADRPALRITHLPAWVGGFCLAATGLLWWLIWYVLAHFTDSNVPVADAFTTALSILALWMMARKYAEQWLAWLIVDAVCVGLYIYKGIYLYASLYAAYTVIAVFGYRKWLQLMKEH